MSTVLIELPTLSGLFLLNPAAIMSAGGAGVTNGAPSIFVSSIVSTPPDVEPGWTILLTYEQFKEVLNLYAKAAARGDTLLTFTEIRRHLGLPPPTPSAFVP
jgi:hypothetical protein